MTPTTPDEVVITPDEVQTPDRVETPEQRAEHLGWSLVFDGWCPPGVTSAVDAWADTRGKRYPRGADSGWLCEPPIAALTAALNEWEGLPVEERARISGWERVGVTGWHAPGCPDPGPCTPWCTPDRALLSDRFDAWLASLRKPAPIPAEVAPDDRCPYCDLPTPEVEAKLARALRDVEGLSAALARADDSGPRLAALHDLLHGRGAECSHQGIGLPGCVMCDGRLERADKDAFTRHLTRATQDIVALQDAAHKDAETVAGLTRERDAARAEIAAVDAALGLTGPADTRYEDQRAINIRALQRERDTFRAGERKALAEVVDLHRQLVESRGLASGLLEMGVALARRDGVSP